MSSDFKKSLQLQFKLHGLPISANQERLLSNYFALSQKWGAKINITANLALDSFLDENILDPALALKAIRDSAIQPDPSFQTLIDIGCGGGYVGLVWAILSEFSFELFLLDSDRKKINFCKQFIRENNLPSCQTIITRVEDFIKNNKGNQFDMVVSRATWEYKTFYLNCHRLARPQGWLAYFHGSRPLPNNSFKPHAARPYFLKTKKCTRQVLLCQKQIIK